MSAAQNNFQNPRTGDGVLGKIHGHKPEVYTYFFLYPADIKTFVVSLYERVYFTKKIFRLTVFSRGLYSQVDATQDTFYFRNL